MNRKRVLIVSAWALAVAVVASQWYLYDAIRKHAERPIYYLATCAYLFGVLTPLVFWLGRRPLPLHIALYRTDILLPSVALIPPLAINATF